MDSVDTKKMRMKYMRGNFKMTKNIATGYKFIKMEINMKANGKTIKNMDKVN